MSTLGYVGFCDDKKRKVRDRVAIGGYISPQAWGWDGEGKKGI
jgi:hypothetical protein